MLTWSSNLTVQRGLGLAFGIAAAAALVTACTGNEVAEPVQSSKTEVTHPATTGSTSDVTPAAYRPGTGGGAVTADVEDIPTGPPFAATGSPDAFEKEPIAAAIDLSPESIADAWREGVSSYEAGDFAGAAGALRTAATGRSEDHYVHYLLGLALWKSGDPEGAEQALVRSAELNPDALRTWVNLARVRLDRDDPHGALDATDAALTVDASSADALHQRGRALADLNRGDEALDTLKRAAAADPGNGYIANSVGYLLIQMGRPQEALPFLESAGAELPGVPFVRNNLGVAYERLGRIEQAVEEYRAAAAAGDSEGKAVASIARLEPLLPQAATEQEGIAEVEGDTPEVIGPVTRTASVDVDPEEDE